MLGLFSYMRIPAALFCLVVLAACQTMGGTGLIQSEVTAKLSTEAANSIAADMVGRLAEHIGPASTTIALRGNDVVFGPALEASLRDKGYAGANGAAGAVPASPLSVMQRRSAGRS